VKRLKNSNRHGQLGLVLAALGKKKEAINEQAAVELLPESQDAFLMGHKPPLPSPRFMP